MNLENYVNLTTWVDELNSTIEDVLLERLKDAIHVWTTAFNSDEVATELYGHKTRKTAYNNITDEQATKNKSIGMEGIRHELTIRNQLIFLEPPLEQARSTCLSSLHDWLGSASYLLSYQCRCGMQSSTSTGVSLRTFCPSVFARYGIRLHIRSFGHLTLR